MVFSVPFLPGARVDLPLDEISRRLRVAFAATLGCPLLPGHLTTAEARYARRLGARMLALASADPRDHVVAPQGLRPLKVAGGVYIHAVESDLGGCRLRMSLRVHGETIVAARVDPAPGLDHTTIERALADTLLATWRDTIALRADALRVISPPPAA